ncbi:MAG TPA: c-type cytochrome biogenesis protein CcmI [Stellaceae bacterium]|nr:c-type cytochrome biogenesis protein CcmI [Stellaceae bacterium]
MLLWAVLGALTAVALVVLLRPLARRGSADAPEAELDVRLFRGQLAALARDVERGVIGEAEAAAARIEIERRLLAAAPAAATSSVRPSRLVQLLVLVFVPIVSVGLYLWQGAPDLPDAPHEATAQKTGEDPQLESLRGQLEARLVKEPDSLQGWLYLAQTDGALGRWPDAHAAMTKALALSDRSAEVVEAYGTMLVAEAQGAVTPEAQAAFEETIRKRPDAIRARYELGLARAQQGDFAGALEEWRALEASAPPDAPWLDEVRKAVAAAEDAGKHAGGSAMPAGKPPAEVAAIMNLPPGERGDAIRSMVAGLAERLAKEPNDPDGWKRLGRSYLVLGQPKDAADAYAKGLALAPDDPELALGDQEALRSMDEQDGVPLSPATVKACRKVASLEPDQPGALWCLGLAAKQQGDDATARSLWGRLADKLDPKSAEGALVRKQLDALAPAK